MLCVELSSEDRIPETRHLAGLLLKNSLTAKVRAKSTFHHLMGIALLSQLCRNLVLMITSGFVRNRSDFDRCHIVDFPAQFVT